MLLDCNLEYKKGESQVSGHLLFAHLQSDALKRLLCRKVLLEKEGSKSPYHTVLVSFCSLKTDFVVVKKLWSSPLCEEGSVVFPSSCLHFSLLTVCSVFLYF